MKESEIGATQSAAYAGAVKQGGFLNSAISAGLSLGTQLLQGYQNKKAQERQQAYDLEMMNYQNDYNLQMWNMQNAYNSPVNQMSRYQAAGLNPNLIYGQGNSGNASSAPSASDAANKTTVPFMNFNAAQGLSMYQDLQMKQKQMDLLDTQIDAVAQKTNNDFLKSIGLGYSNKILGYNEQKSWMDYVWRTKPSENKGLPNQWVYMDMLDYQMDAAYQRSRAMSLDNQSRANEIENWRLLQITRNPAVNKALQMFGQAALGYFGRRHGASLWK